MGLCLGKTSSSSPWSELPPELAGVILARLPSHADRLSFGAVCRNWHHAARNQGPLLPPAMPWLNLGLGTYQSLPDGRLHRFRETPTTGAVRASAAGGWLMRELEVKHPRYRCFLQQHNSSVPMEIPFVLARGYKYHRCSRGCKYDHAADNHPLQEHRNIAIEEILDVIMVKIIVCSPHLVAAMFFHFPSNHKLNFAFFHTGKGLVWLGAAGRGTSGDGRHHWNGYNDYHYKDIAYHQGKIFALTSEEQLMAHELVHDGEPAYQEPSLTVIGERPPTAAPPVYRVKRHLVVSSDEKRLLMVRWSIPKGHQVHDTEMNLEVFEANLKKHQWSQVTDLGSDVLFLSEVCSKALPSSSMDHFHDRRFRSGNCVFILGVDWIKCRVGRCGCRRCRELCDGTPSYCVYNMRSGETSLVLVDGGHYVDIGRSEWFFPAYE